MNSMKPIENHRVKNRERLIFRSAIFLALGVCLIFLSLFFRLKLNSNDYQPERLDFSDVPPLYTSDQKPQFKKFYLQNRWQYLLTTEKVDHSSQEFLRDSDWKLLEDRERFQFNSSGLVNVWYKVHFRLDDQFVHPSLVLGLIPDYHRVYLNGKFIGGSNYSGIIGQYSFDSSLLEKKNILLIHAQRKARTLPAIVSLSELGGTYISEFSTGFNRLVENLISHHVLRFVFLVLALLMGIGCLIYFLYQKKALEFLYFSLFFVISSANLLKSQFYLYSVMSDKFIVFVGLIASAFSMGLMVSAFLRVNRKGRLEFFNNILLTVTGIALYLSLVASHPDVISIQEIKELAYSLISAYGLITLLYMVSLSLERRLLKTQHSTLNLYVRSISYLIASSLFLTVIYSLSHSPQFSIGSEVRTVLRQVGIFYPFLFTLGVLIISLSLSVWNTRLLMERHQTSQLLVDLSSLIFDSSNLDHDINLIQEKICKFLGAERSTIYFLEDHASKKSFKAEFIYGPWNSTQFVNHVIPTDKGLLGHVFKNRTPILVRNFKDLEEKLGIQQRRNESFKSESCMLLPLKTDNDFVGVLTVADPRGKSEFSQQQFALMQTVAKDIALILRQVRTSLGLNQQLSGLLKLVDSGFSGFISQAMDEEGSIVWFAASIGVGVNYPHKESLNLSAGIYELFQKERSELSKEEESYRERIFKIVDEDLGFQAAYSWIGETKKIIHELKANSTPVDLNDVQYEAIILVVSHILADYQKGTLSFDSVEKLFSRLITKKASHSQLFTEAFSFLNQINIDNEEKAAS